MAQEPFNNGIRFPPQDRLVYPINGESFPQPGYLECIFKNMFCSHTETTRVVCAARLPNQHNNIYKYTVCNHCGTILKCEEHHPTTSGYELYKEY